MSAASTTSSSSSPSSQYLDILKVAKLVQKPVSDEAAAQAIINGVHAALSGFGPCGPQHRQLLKGKAAAQMSSCVPAALRCAAWLVAARESNPGAREGFWQAVRRCLFFVYAAFGRVEMGPDLLRGVLQQGPVPGLTTWLPLLAAELLSSPAASAAAAPAPGDFSKWASTEELLVVAWGMLQITCRRYSRNAQAAPPAWLHPAMVQLADAVLQRPGRVRLAQGVITQPLTAASAGASPMANPRLCAAAGRQADPSIGAQVAAAVQQGFWWRALATCCQAIAEAKALPPWQLQCHPRLFNPAACFNGQGYPGRALSANTMRDAANLAWQALHALLVAQLWDIWPWQLQQLCCEGQTQVGGAVTAAAPTTASSSRSGSSRDSSGSDTSNRSCASQALSAVQQPVYVSRSRSSGGGPAGFSRPLQQCQGSALLWERDVMQWPLVPESLQEGHGLQPVTLQQLQLVAAATGYAEPSGAISSGLLLALLLQRVGPGLRAEFLGGPGGSILLSACEVWGHDYERSQVPGVAAPTFHVLDKPPGCVAPSMIAALCGDSIEGSEDWRPVGVRSSFGLVLAWCYLQLVPGWEEQLEHLRGGGKEAMHSYELLTTANHYHSCQRLMGTAPECCVIRSVPRTAVRFAPGCSPTPQLLGTLEMLLRGDDLHPSLAQCITTFVHATVACLDGSAAGVSVSGPVGDELACSNSGYSSAGPSPCGSGHSDCSSRDGHPNTSSSDPGGHCATQDVTRISSGSQHGKCMSLLDKQGLLQALAGLAVTWAVRLQHTASGLTSDRQQEVLAEVIEGLVHDLLPRSATMAADLLHLVARQLQAPGPTALPALQLAAAAQQLAGQCAHAAHTTSQMLELWLDWPTGDATPAAAAAETPPQDCTGIPSSRHKHACMLLETLEASLQVLQGGVVALQQVRCGAGQQQQQQTYGAHKVDASSGSIDKGTSGTVGSSSGFAYGSTFPSITTTSSSGSDVAMAQVVVHSRLQAIASSIHRACRPRVQLVGCNSLCCTNLSGDSAEGLVTGLKGVRCGGCRVARYCTPGCQKEDWEQHRQVCRRLATAGLKLER